MKRIANILTAVALLMGVSTAVQAQSVEDNYPYNFITVQGGVQGTFTNYDFTKLINENIDKCSRLFYDWIVWDYIRDLFFIPKYQKAGVLKDDTQIYFLQVERVHGAKTATEIKLSAMEDSHGTKQQG